MHPPGSSSLGDLENVCSSKRLPSPSPASPLGSEPLINLGEKKKIIYIYIFADSWLDSPGAVIKFKMMTVPTMVWGFEVEP